MRGSLLCYTSLIFVSVSMETVSPSSPVSACTKNQFQCTNGQCIPSMLVCNNKDDCRDGSDERSCKGCGKGQFSCDSGGIQKQCIDPVLVCNFVCDCTFNPGNCKDEQDCFQPTQAPKPNSFSNRLFISFSVFLTAISIILMLAMVCMKRYKSRSPQIRTNEVGTSSEPMEQSTESYEAAFEDLPPNYETVAADNCAFIIESPSCNSLPTYDEAKHLSFGSNPGLDLPSPPMYSSIQAPSALNEHSSNSETHEEIYPDIV